MPMRHDPEYHRKKVWLLRLLNACRQQHFSTLLRLVREDISVHTDLAGPDPMTFFGIGQCSLFLQQLFRLPDGADPVVRIRPGEEHPLALFYHPDHSSPYATFIAEERDGRIGRVLFLRWEGEDVPTPVRESRQEKRL